MLQDTFATQIQPIGARVVHVVRLKRPNHCCHVVSFIILFKLIPFPPKRAHSHTKLEVEGKKSKRKTTAFGSDNVEILGKTTASAARSGGSSTTEVCGVGDELISAWELVNASQSDDEDRFSYDSEEAASTGDSVSDEDLEPVPAEDVDEKDVGVDEDAPAPRDFVSASDIIAIQAMSVSPPMTLPVEMTLNYVARDYAEYCDDGDVKDVEGGDDDEDDDCDFDDELVPWKLKGRFGKQRIRKMGIRKMGQRGGPKLTAKKLPYYDNRPGFAHGKLR